MTQVIGVPLEDGVGAVELFQQDHTREFVPMVAAGPRVRPGVDVGTRATFAEIERAGKTDDDLAALDALGDFRIERLDADFKLQRAGRKTGDGPSQFIRQPVGNHLEMEKQSGPAAIEKKFQHGQGRIEIEVEGAVDELKLPHAAVEQPFEAGEERLLIGLPQGDVK